MSKRLWASGLALLLTACAAPAEPSPSAGAPNASSLASPAASLSATPGSVPSQTAVAAEPMKWTQLDVDAPAAREDHTWTVDGDGRVAYLFGGRDGSTAFDDLWAYDLELDAWEQIDATPGPEGRFGHEAAWVDGVGLVVFAGQAGSSFFADLWAFWPPDGTWRQLPANGDAPVARYGTCAAVGPDGRLWISHGFTADGSRFADTRAYDFGAQTWTDETPDGAAPVERCLHGCWWTDDGALALYAGQTTGVTALGDRWLLSGGTWTELDGAMPPERNLYARARLDGATLVFGGQALDGGYLADMWLLVDGRADAVPVQASGAAPPGRAGAEMVRDAARGRILLFGGRDVDGPRADLWVLTGGVAAGG
ncbi:MAG TPA: kelch repeat-containing protein [Candidatus Limnocylindria bacterium]|nr:kelch repeat-containing protein [Candidatus Limnocylindria bacterium]